MTKPCRVQKRTVSSGGVCRSWLQLALLLAPVMLLAACAGRVARVEEIASDAAHSLAESASIDAHVPAALAASAPLTTTPAPTQSVVYVTPVIDADYPSESAPRIIPLAAPLNQRGAEVSGMAWLGDTLVIMPQYTNFADAGVHQWYTLPGEEIVAWIRGEIDGPLTPDALPVITNGVPFSIAGYEGFESLAFDQAGKVFLTSEATASWVTAAWLLGGTVADDPSSVTLDPSTMTWIEPQSLTLNHSDEALVLTPDDGLFTLYEVNGAEVNTEPTPLAHTFGRDLAARGAIPFPTIEYRITDATPLDADNRFWAINYFFPNDDALATDHDPIAEEYGEGKTHAQRPQVERLLEFEWRENEIVRTDTPPIQLELSLISRNWEGIVRLDDGDTHLGFLLITDQFPDTILAFVPFPDASESP